MPAVIFLVVDHRQETAPFDRCRLQDIKRPLSGAALDRNILDILR